MSHLSNDNWAERAAECIDFFEGNLPARVIEADLERNDWESLVVHVQEAEAEIARQELYGYNIMGERDEY